MTSCYICDMSIEKKKTHTYAAPPSVVERARKKAEKEGVTLSEKICYLLKEYAKRNRKSRYMTVAEANEWLKENSKL